jgi:hypothetical protein
MPVNVDPLQITPYTSTVPLVQTPPDQTEAVSRPAPPLQGNVLGKGTGALAIGDSLLKGFMAGHQQKVQRKTDQAETAIAAAGGMREAAYQKYQQNLRNLGNPPDQTKDPDGYTKWKQQADGFYKDYTGVVQQSKDGIAQYVIPEKTPKGQQKKGEKKTGWNSFKDFFEANPHIVPNLALLAIQPNPPGLSSQGQEQVQNLESQKLANQKQSEQLQNEKIYKEGFATFAHLSPDELKSLPPAVSVAYGKWVNARAAITPLKFTGTPQLYKLPNGEIVRKYKEEIEQYYPDAVPYIPGAEIKPGSPAELEDKYLKSIGVTRQDATLEQLAAATQYAKAAQTAQTSSTTTSTQDISGNRTSTTSRKATPGAIAEPPTARAGVRPPPKSAASPTGVTPPPQAAKNGQISRPPGMTKETWQTMQVTRQATEKQQKGYQKAESDYTKAMRQADGDYAKAIKDGVDPTEAGKTRDRANARAQLDLEDAKAAVAKTYDAAVKSIGGASGSQQSRQYRYSTEPNAQGVVLGSDDGQNWFNTQTGQPYQQ